jgi:hypothetical protein
LIDDIEELIDENSHQFIDQTPKNGLTVAGAARAWHQESEVVLRNGTEHGVRGA